MRNEKIIFMVLNYKSMDIAVKKVELIEWLAGLQDESLLQRIDALRKGSVKQIYESRMPKSQEEIQQKLDRSEEDIKAGRVHGQEDVETYFKNKFTR
jgi:hypothetical protein